MYLPLLATFDGDENAWVALVQLLASFDGGHRTQEGVAIVDRAATVELAIDNLRLRGVWGLHPACTIRLLVQVSIEKYSLLAFGFVVERFNLDDQERASPLILQLVDCDPLESLRAQK